MSNILNVHHAISESGLYVRFEPSTTKTAEKKDAPPPPSTIQCNADKSLERNVAQLLGGTLTYRQLFWNLTTDRMQSSNDPEEAHLPSRLEVRDEYARSLAHAGTCVTCLMKYGGEISSNHLRHLGILRSPTTIN